MSDGKKLSATEQQFMDMMDRAPRELKLHNPNAGLPSTPDDMDILHKGIDTVEAHMQAHGNHATPRFMRRLQRSFRRTGSEHAALSAVGVERFAELMAEGYSLAEIASELNVSHLTLARWIQSKGDSEDLLRTAERLGADALIAEATRRLRNIDVEARGGAAAAAAFAEFAKWRAATIDPDAFGPAGARVAGASIGSGISVQINVDYDSALPMQAEVVDANVLRLNRENVVVDDGDAVVMSVPHEGTNKTNEE